MAISGTVIRLLSAAGQTTVVALGYLLAAEDFELVGAAPAPKVDPLGLLETLPEKVVQAARTWERHLIEVDTGVAPDAPKGTRPRPEYDPVTHSLAARQRAKAVELTAAGTRTSVRTVERMRQRYREQGLWGLVDTRYARAVKPAGNVDARVVAAAATVVEAQTATSTGTKSRAIRQIREMLDDEHGPGVVPMPSRATCYRLLEALSAAKYTFGAATTRRQAANKPARPYAVTTANRPGEQVQMDSTPLDVMAVMDDGVIGRAELVLAIDIATRTICAGVLRPVGAALLLARVMVPELMRPGWDAALAMSASRIPHQRLISLDTRMALAAAKPVIVPDTVVIDHGKVFLSEVFLRAANTLGISVQPAHQQTPTDKAIVERTFESINTLFCQHVAGYTGRDVTRRGADVAERAVWSLPDLQELFDEWVIAGWQSRPHDGLRHPFTLDQAASPNDAYAALVAAAGYVPVTLTGEDYIELLPADWRAIGDGGIQIDYRTYNCPELRPYVRKSSGVSSRAGRWEVHYDPYDISRIWVRAQPPPRRLDHGSLDALQRGRAAVRRLHLAGFPQDRRTAGPGRHQRDDRRGDLAALLRRADEGSGSGRALARTRSAHLMSNHLPPELTTAALAAPAAPEPGPSADPPPALPASEPEAEQDEPPVLVGEVVPFALFDPFADDLEAGR